MKISKKEIAQYLKLTYHFWKGNAYSREYVTKYKTPFSLLVKEQGKANYGKCVYYIDLEDLDCVQDMGFFALINDILKRLYCADRLGFEPYVSISKKNLYYSSNMDSSTQNMFEYFFMPICPGGINAVKTSYNLIYSMEKDVELLEREVSGYELTAEKLKLLSAIWKKYFILNETTKKMLESDLQILNKYEKVLGIHIRGTDYKKNLRRHPIAVTLDEYLEALKKAVEEGEYEAIFCATDEKKALLKLKELYGDKVVYFEDTLRSIDGNPIHKGKGHRKNQGYFLGYEVLRDMYTLAKCNALVGGISQVTLAARICKIALEEEYDYIRILDKGMNQ